VVAPISTQNVGRRPLIPETTSSQGSKLKGGYGVIGQPNRGRRDRNYTGLNVSSPNAVNVSQSSVSRHYRPGLKGLGSPFSLASREDSLASKTQEAEQVVYAHQLNAQITNMANPRNLKKSADSRA